MSVVIVTTMIAVFVVAIVAVFITVLIAILVTIAVMVLVLIFVVVVVPIMVTILFMIVKYSMSSGFLRMAYDPAQAGEKTRTQYGGKWYKTLHLLPLSILYTLPNTPGDSAP
jgi:hypothetical protein